MRLFNKVAIVGLGLIGGSIALALKKRRLCNRVIGVSRRGETIKFAQKKGLIDIGSRKINIIKDADLIILAAPVDSIIDLAQSIAKVVQKDCLVTDVGSTKKEIVLKLEKIFPNFVGSHPLAGSEKKGLINAHSEMFKGNLCILTPAKRTKKQAQKKIEGLWKRLGARLIHLDVNTHDRILSFVSHLPHAVAFSLANSVRQEYLKFAYSGFKDTTRIAGSDSQLWAGIFLSNRANILRGISLFERNLGKIKAAIKKQDKKVLVKILNEAKKKRDSLN